MTSSLFSVRRKKSPLFGLTLSCYAIMGATAIGTTLLGTGAFANEPTSLLNPKIENTPKPKPLTPTTEQSANTGNANTENTGTEDATDSTNPDSNNLGTKPLATDTKQSLGDGAPTADDATANNERQKELDDLLDELSQPPNYSEKTQPATTPVSGIVRTEELQTISEDSFGLVEPNQDNINIWKNTSYGSLVNLVNASTLSITSPTLYKSTMDILLLGAQSPKLQSPHKQGDYLLARVALLSRTGHIKTARQLLSDSPIGTSLEHQGQLLDLTLLGHDVPSACLTSKELSQTSPLPNAVDPLLVKQMVILCKGISDNPATAHIAASALQETSEQVSFLFVDTLDYLNGGPAPDQQSLDKLTPFTLLLARLTGMPINKDLLSQASPDVLHSASAHPNTTDEARVYALEQLAHTGAISIAELSAGYDRITFSDEELQNPLQFLYDLEPPLQRALLVRASKRENGWKHAITLLNRIKTSEDYLMISNVLATDFVKLTPSPEYEYAAAIIARSLLASGHVEQAQLWYNERHQFDTATNNAIATLYPALVLAKAHTTRISLDDNDTKLWAEQMAKYPDHGLKALTRGLSVLHALGFVIDEKLWDYLDGSIGNNTQSTMVASSDRFLALPNSGVTLLEKFAQSGKFAPPTVAQKPQQDLTSSTNEAGTSTQMDNVTQSDTPLPPSKKQRGMTALYATNLVGKETASTLSDDQVIRIINALKNAFGDEVARSYALESLVRQYNPSTQ